METRPYVPALSTLVPPPPQYDRSGRGSVVLLLNSGDPVPLHTWRLPNDTPTCLQLLLDTTNSGGRDGVLCLTRKGELVLLSVASREGDGKVLAPRPQVSELMYVALDVMKHRKALMS